jgi:hypothetical protein
MNIRKLTTNLFMIAAIMMTAAAARARNVDLSTVPDRASVQLTIYNSEDLTLVRETRKISFTKGNNPLQFSWANTLIDPTSVELQFLDHKAELEMQETTYPHDKPQMLYWNVQSEFAGEATIEISYFTSGLSWQADYTAITNPEETTLHLEGFVRVFNNSGEDYENAQVRLVVGKVNLVERIAQLAQRPVSELGKDDINRYRLQEMRRSVGKAEVAMDAAAPQASGFGAAKEIIKEGLSEYFIYTIEGTETIPTGWSKRLHSFEGEDVPFEVVYRYRPREYGEQLIRMYILTNDEKSKLGTTPLPDGIVRVFRKNGKDGMSYLAAQTVKYIPIGDKIELNLGADKEVVFELVKVRVRRDEIWLRMQNINVLRKVEGGIQVEDNSPVVGWDDHTLYNQRVRNYTSKPINVEIRRTWPGDIIFRSGLNPKMIDYQTVEFTSSVKPAEKQDLLFEIVQKQGTNAKQSRIILQDAKLTLE